jgi:hypothetical protein
MMLGTFLSICFLLLWLSDIIHETLGLKITPYLINSCKESQKNPDFLGQSGFSANTINQREAAVSKSRLTNQRLMVENLMSN